VSRNPNIGSELTAVEFLVCPGFFRGDLRSDSRQFHNSHLTLCLRTHAPRVRRAVASLSRTPRNGPWPEPTRECQRARTCRPELVCTSLMRARDGFGRRCASEPGRATGVVDEVTLPNGAADQHLLRVANARETSRSDGPWVRHQPPRMRSPAMASASDGTGPCADSRTTPCSRTNARASRGSWSDSFVQPNRLSI